MEVLNDNKAQDIVIFYIRHGEDKITKHKLDHHLTSQGKKNAKTLAKKLTKKHGVPNIIYCSPFYRTIKTANEMKRALKSIGVKDVEIKIDIRIGRYFSKKERKHGRESDISSATVDNGAITSDDWNQFKSRVSAQLTAVKENKKGYKVVWNITHAIVLNQIAKFEHIKKGHNVNYLETLQLPS